jgi:hypothetical protein
MSEARGSKEWGERSGGHGQPLGGEGGALLPSLSHSGTMEGVRQRLGKASQPWEPGREGQIELARSNGSKRSQAAKI